MLKSRQSYPACVTTCIENTMAIANTFGGCSADDFVCLCSHANFGYAIRDCTAAICDSTDAEEGISYVLNACTSAAAAATSNAGSSVSSVTATTYTTYTTFTTTGIFTWPVSGELEVSTYTFTETVTNASYFTWLQRQTLSTLSTNTTVSQASTSALISTPASTTAISGENSRGDGGLTAGAKIGIGVGVPVGVLSVLGAAAVLFWRSRQRRGRGEVQNFESNAWEGKAELDNKDLPRTHGRSELSEQRAPVEMDSTVQTRDAELHGDDVPVAELRTNVTSNESATQSSALGQERSERHILP